MKFKSFFRLTVACGIILGCFACGGKLSKESISIKTDRDSVAMGRSIIVTAHINLKSGVSPKDILLLPYVDQRRWGSQEHPDSNGNATFLLPCLIRAIMIFRLLLSKPIPITGWALPINNFSLPEVLCLQPILYQTFAM